MKWKNIICVVCKIPFSKTKGELVNNHPYKCTECYWKGLVLRGKDINDPERVKMDEAERKWMDEKKKLEIVKQER